MSSVLKLRELKNIQGTKDKMAFITANKDDTEFLYTLKVLLDDTFVLGVKTIPEDWWKNSVGKLSAKEAEFRQLVEYLRNNNRSAKTMETIVKFLKTCNRQEAEVYAGVLTKSYKVGLTVKSVNKALPEPLAVKFTLQKAEPFDESKLTFTKGYILGEEEYDGVRCAIFVDDGNVTAFTYNGKLVKLTTIGRAFKRLCEDMGVDRMVFDCELLSKKQRVSTSGLVNKLIKKPEDNTDEELYAMVFHFMSIEEFKNQKCSSTNEEVANKLGALDANGSANRKIKFSKSYVLRNMDEIEALFKEVREKGGEGLMLKDPDAHYEWKRSSTWLKLKSIYSTTLRVHDVYLAGDDTKYKGLVGGLVCITEDCKMMINVGSGLSDTDRVHFLEQDKIVDQLVEVAFTDINFDENGKPFLDFPRFKGIRTDKNEADTVEQMLAEVPKWNKLKGK